MLSNTTQESLSVWNRQLIQERNARGAAGVTVRQLESLIRCGSVGNEAKTGSPKNRLCSVARDDSWDFECMRYYVISRIEIIAAGWTQDLANVWNKQGFLSFIWALCDDVRWVLQDVARRATACQAVRGNCTSLPQRTCEVWALSPFLSKIHGCEFLWICRRNDVLIRAEHVREAFELQVRRAWSNERVWVYHNIYCCVCISGLALKSILFVDVCVYLYIKILIYT